MDQQKRQQLIAKVKEQGGTPGGDSSPVVSLEDFFVGNDDYGSIGCNLPDSPGPAVFFDLLRAIRAKPEVQDVLVEIDEVIEDDETHWPFSAIVYVLTSASLETVQEWLSPPGQDIAPDEVSVGYTFGTPTGAPPLQPGMTVYTAWWD